MNKDEALKMAIEAMGDFDYDKRLEALKACKEALAQPVIKDSLTVQKPLSGEEIIAIKIKEGLGNWYNFARTIEKAHGIE